MPSEYPCIYHFWLKPLVVLQLIDDSGRVVKNTSPLISIHTQIAIIAQGNYGTHLHE